MAKEFPPAGNMKNCRFKVLFTYVPYIHLLYTVCYFTPSAGFCLKLTELLDQERFIKTDLFSPPSPLN